jgi:hypothetical protein
MPRRRPTIHKGEGRDIDGIVHIASKHGLWMQAKCNGVAIGTNDFRLKSYCPACFPEYVDKVRLPKNYRAHESVVCEEITTPSDSISRPVKPKPAKITNDKTLDTILRKSHNVFNRRELKPTLQDHWERLTKK